MKEQDDAISVVIPVRNRPTVIWEAVNSALKIESISEVLVVDDNSTEPLKVDCHVDPKLARKVRLLKNNDVPGAQGARLTGVRAAENDLILFLDSDDLLIPAGVMALRREMSGGRSLCLVYSDVIRKGKRSGYLRLDGMVFPTVLKNLSLCSFSGVLVRKSLIAWDAISLSLPAWQDDDFCLVASQCGPVRYIDQPAAEQRYSTVSISSSRKNQLIGLILLLDKWKERLVKHHGVFILLLWRIRVSCLLSDMTASEIAELSREKLAMQPLTLIVWALKVYSKLIRATLRLFFDRVSV